jgi:hypothetical protein
MACPSCNTPVASNAHVCPKCGHRFTHPFGTGLAAICGIILLGVIMRAMSSGAGPSSPSVSNQYHSPQNLALQISGARTASGAAEISGRIALPDQTKLWVEVGKSKADAIVQSGAFSAADFDDELRPLQGAQRVRIEAMFNGAWQPDSVLELVGPHANRLKGDCAKRTDLM